MNFRFFGDSWAWTWWHDENTGNSSWLKSQQVRSLRATDVSHNNKRKPDPTPDPAISFIDIYLNKLFGYEVETFNSPGESFTQTLDVILRTPQADTDTVNVIFYAEPIRGATLKELISSDGTCTYDQIEAKLYKITTDLLFKLGTYANKTNQKFIISGGQSTLYTNIFNSVPEDARKNLTLLHPCILSSTMSDYSKDNNHTILGPFKFTECVGGKVSDPVDWEGIHHSIPNAIFEQITDCHEQSQSRTWPDVAHMNPGATLLFIDDLLHCIEDK